MAHIPETQYAVQLVAPDKLVLNTSKNVIHPGQYQILCRVEAVGLCFSDLKLLKQFSSHIRKGNIISGVEQEILDEIPSYVPGDAPTVPGHEAVVRIEATGPQVENFKPGQRYLVQTDYRWLRTASSNAAFGYNFEGALQEYVLMDQRVITSPDGRSMLIPVPEELSASAVAMVEPWACVENAYASKERRRLKNNGLTLIVADVKLRRDVLLNLFDKHGRPREITLVSKSVPQNGLDFHVKKAASIAELKESNYDDVLYFGSDARTVESLYLKVAGRGLLNIVLCGGQFGRNVVTAVGRVHYEGIRIVGTRGSDPADSMKVIPETGGIRAGDKVHVVGAGGPMGTMHVIRNICHGIEGISVFADDLDDCRLSRLTKIAGPLAKRNKVRYEAFNPAKKNVSEALNYTVLMAPVPNLVAASVRTADNQGIINIFAGIPTNVTANIDMDSYIQKQLYFTGTSGSVLEDMKRVLTKVESGRLDTNVCVAAICGLEGASNGIRAVENRLIAGKITVYPSCKRLGLVPLEKLQSEIPQVAECLTEGLWNKRAEDVLLGMHLKPES